MRTNDHPHHRLEDLLREGDPAGAGSKLSRAEAAELRRLVLRNVHPIPRMHWIPIAAVAAALLVVVLLLPGKTPPAPEEHTPEPPRQIRFATEQGTQIIWVLNANLDLWNQES